MPSFFVSCAQGLSPFVNNELKELGIEAKTHTTGLSFDGEIKDGYQVCLWSRCASKVFLSLQHGEFKGIDELYQELLSFGWSDHLTITQTFLISVTAAKQPNLNTHFMALKAKDAIVDYFRNKEGERPNVDKDQPDLRFHLHITDKEYTLYLDFSGESLHKRGFRQDAGVAPIKENLAAALLYRLNWPEMAKDHNDFLDPLCGAGTILIEAALMARDIAPGLFRKRFGFLKWKQHQQDIWSKLVTDAAVRADEGEENYQGKLYGVEISSKMIGITKINADRAGVLEQVHLFHQSFLSFKKPQDFKGLIVTNPPYGVRLGDQEALKHTYAQLGDWLKTNFSGCRAGVITSDENLGKSMGLKASKVNKYYNGSLECLYLQFNINEDYFVDREKLAKRQMDKQMMNLMDDGGSDFKNRLLKNKKKFETWVKNNQNKIECYRVYYCDLPEFNVAVDFYKEAIVIQEFAAPKTIDKEKAKLRLDKITAIVPTVYPEIDADRIYLKQRERKKGKAQYERLNQTDEETDNYFSVTEGKAKFWVNLVDYIDTGLFLDHRNIRFMIGALAKDKRFLNLFAYTATASVHAALGGAKSTKSVDLSNTYLNWASENFALNDLKTNTHSQKHQLIRADVMEWLTKEAKHLNELPEQRQNDSQYDLIFMDPPSFSNSKNMDDFLDIQADHIDLIESAMQLLDQKGILIFSTNFRKFTLDSSVMEKYQVEDISLSSLPEDFKRDPKIRQCFKISFL